MSASSTHGHAVGLAGCALLIIFLFPSLLSSVGRSQNTILRRPHIIHLHLAHPHTMAQDDDDDQEDDYKHHQMSDSQEQEQQERNSSEYPRENRLIDFQRLVLQLVSSRPDALNAKNRKALTEDIVQRITSSSSENDDQDDEDDSLNTAEACRAILAEWTGAYERTFASCLVACLVGLLRLADCSKRRTPFFA